MLAPPSPSQSFCSSQARLEVHELVKWARLILCGVLEASCMPPEKFVTREACKSPRRACQLRKHEWQVQNEPGIVTASLPDEADIRQLDNTQTAGRESCCIS